MKAKLCAIALTLLTVVGVPTIASAASADAALSCGTATQAKVGTGVCSGSGYWKVKVACKWQPDQYSSRLYQAGGTGIMSAKCVLQAQNTSIVRG